VSIKNYADLIASKYGLDANELLSLWDDNAPAKINNAAPAKKTNGAPAKKTSKLTCAYVVTRGNRVGQLCGHNCRSGNLCCRHNKQLKKKPQAILRKNKQIGNKLWHAETGFVFKSEKDKIVIGKCVDNIINDLSDDDVKVCMANGFRYEKKANIDVNDQAKDVEILLAELQDSSAADIYEKKANIDVNDQAKDVEILLAELQDSSAADSDFLEEEDD